MDIDLRGSPVGLGHLRANSHRQTQVRQVDTLRAILDLVIARQPTRRCSGNSESNDQCASRLTQSTITVSNDQVNRGTEKGQKRERLILRFGGLVGKYHPKPLCGRQLWRDFGLSNYLI